MLSPAPDQSNQNQGFPAAEPVVQTLPSMRDLDALEGDLNQIDTTLAELDRTQVGAS